MKGRGQQDEPSAAGWGSVFDAIGAAVVGQKRLEERHRLPGSYMLTGWELDGATWELLSEREHLGRDLSDDERALFESWWNTTVLELLVARAEEIDLPPFTLPRDGAEHIVEELGFALDEIKAARQLGDSSELREAQASLVYLRCLVSWATPRDGGGTDRPVGQAGALGALELTRIVPGLPKAGAARVVLYMIEQLGVGEELSACNKVRAMVRMMQRRANTGRTAST